jgi:hypothetical protein
MLTLRGLYQRLIEIFTCFETRPTFFACLCLRRCKKISTNIELFYRLSFEKLKLHHLYQNSGKRCGKLCAALAILIMRESEGRAGPDQGQALNCGAVWLNLCWCVSTHCEPAHAADILGGRAGPERAVRGGATSPTHQVSMPRGARAATAQFSGCSLCPLYDSREHSAQSFLGQNLLSS